MNLPVYLDCHATTPVDPRVLEAMLPFFTEKFGNAASRQHQFGWVADEAVESSRTTIARAIGATPKEIVFTSGATESNNLAIKGYAETVREKGNHIITAATEHKSVLDSGKHLEKLGYQVTYLGVDGYGLLDLDQLRKAITPETVLVSVMIGNNEIGTIQNIAAIGELCHDAGVLLHSDAAQALGKIPIDVSKLNVDLLAFTAHKLYGPKGIGGLYVRNATPKIRLAIQMDGGGHERGMRSGTLNVPGIVGLAKAVELAVQAMPEEPNRIASLRDRLFNGLREQLDEVYLNGHPTQRLPNNLNVSFGHVDDSALMMSMKDIAVSTGSACSTADPEPSHVLKALHLPADRLHSAIRFGVGRFTTEEQIDYAIGRVTESVKKLRELSPVYHRAGAV